MFYRPQSQPPLPLPNQRPTERVNRFVGNMLAMYVSFNHLDWDAALPLIALAYNSTHQVSTEFSPFYLLFGREPTSKSTLSFHSRRTAHSPSLHQSPSRSSTVGSPMQHRLAGASMLSLRSEAPACSILCWRPRSGYRPPTHLGLSQKLLSQYTE